MVHTHARLVGRVSAVLALALMVGAAGSALGQVTIDGGKKPTPRLAQAPVPQGPAKLIPRAALFGNPEKAGAQLSPDGKYISYLAPVNGVMNIWVAPAEKFEQAKAVTSETKRGIRNYFWAHNSTRLVYMQDANGDENWHAYSVDPVAGKTTDLTPLEKIAAQPMAESDKFPDEIMVGINDRNPELHDVYRVNVVTGERKLVLKNDGYQNFEIDDDFNVRFATKAKPDGGYDEFKVSMKDGKAAFEKTGTVSIADSDSTHGVGFDKTGNVRYFMDSRERDTAALFAVDLTTNKATKLYSNDKVDAGQPLIHPTLKTVQAVEYTYDKSRWELLDRDLERDWQFIRKTSGEGDLQIASRTHDDRFWIVSVAPDNASPRTYLYDRGVPGKDGAKGVDPKLTMLFVTRPALQGQALARMRPEVIKARDGLEMMSYLTLPVGCDANGDGKPDKPLPMVLLVHGGPWARDTWGYNPTHQWLANRGYAVLSVNYRGSTGFGKKFVMASQREWGGKMHTDLIDAVEWATKGQIADPARVAIFGGSYGGYAALAGLTFTPETFACGVDIVGVSNLTTFMKTIPPYWKPELDHMHQMVGDDTTDEGRAFLLSRSPVSKVDQIKRPLLIGQGAHDPRVNKDESDQVVKAMKARNIPVTYIVYPDEGHGFARPENRMSFNAVAEAFLAQHLGKGDPNVRAEPIGASFAGSSIVIEEGSDQVPGLSEAAPKK